MEKIGQRLRISAGSNFYEVWFRFPHTNKWKGKLAPIGHLCTQRYMAFVICMHFFKKIYLSSTPLISNLPSFVYLKLIAGPRCVPSSSHFRLAHHTGQICLLLHRPVMHLGWSPASLIASCIALLTLYGSTTSCPLVPLSLTGGFCTFMLLVIFFVMLLCDVDLCM